MSFVIDRITNMRIYRGDKLIMEFIDRNRGFEVVKDEYRKTQGEVKLPEKGTSKAMAYDFFANDDYIVEPGKVAKIWTDVKAG